MQCCAGFEGVQHIDLIDLCICGMIPTVVLANTSIISHNYHFSSVVGIIKSTLLASLMFIIQSASFSPSVFSLLAVLMCLCVLGSFCLLTYFAQQYGC